MRRTDGARQIQDCMCGTKLCDINRGEIYCNETKLMHKHISGRFSVNIASNVLVYKSKCPCYSGSAESTIQACVPHLQAGT